MGETRGIQIEKKKGRERGKRKEDQRRKTRKEEKGKRVEYINAKGWQMIVMPEIILFEPDPCNNGGGIAYKKRGKRKEDRRKRIDERLKREDEGRTGKYER